MAKVGRNEVCPCGSGKKYKKCCIPTSSRSAPNPQRIQRHHLWRKKYRLHRYLEQLSESALMERAKDIFANMVGLSEQRKYTPGTINAEGQQWMMLWTHILEECSLRMYPYPDALLPLKEAAIPKHDWPGLREGIEEFKLRKLKRGGYTVKYGQSRYLLPLLEKGLVRVAAASMYGDPSLNHAIKDSELEVTFRLSPSEASTEFRDRDGEMPITSITAIEPGTYKLESHTNYYVYCLASTFSPRLFGDFEADSCLIIYRPKEFSDLLQREFDKRLDGWKSRVSSVTYIDPLHVGDKPPDIFFSKHFRFAYQKEFRLVWLPPEPVEALEPVYLELGNLSEYCDLISLPRKKAS